MVDETRDLIQTEVIDIDPRKIKLLDLNPHSMRHEVFQRLVDNIKRDGGLLGNTPFCWHLHDDSTREPQFGKDGEPIYEVISGNHRVKGAVAAGLPLIRIEVTHQYLVPSQRKAIQLSQNAILGEDDPAGLKLVYDSITEPAFRMYTGLNDKTLGLMQQVKVESLSEANLQFTSISMTFLPAEREAVEAVWKDVQESTKAGKGNWLARWQEYDTFLDSLEAANAASGVKNIATGLMIILTIFSQHIADLREHYLDASGEPLDPKRRVPLLSLFDNPLISAQDAAQLNQMLNRAIAESGGAITTPFAALMHLLKGDT